MIRPSFEGAPSEGSALPEPGPAPPGAQASPPSAPAASRAGALADRLAPTLPFSRKMAVTAGSLALFLALPYAHPGLARLRLLEPRAAAEPSRAAPPLEPAPEVIGEAALPGETVDHPRRGDDLEASPVDARGPLARAPSPAEAPAPPPPVAADDATAPPPWQQIEDPSGHALDGLFAKLLRAERREPGAVARILYYGDSIIASDLVTGKLRRLLHTRFGDAGHGYALLADAWPGWFHIDVSRRASANWKTSRVIGPFAEDGLYGLGGVSFRAAEPDAWSRFATVDGGEWGQRVSRFEIEYLAQPGGGDLSLLVDDVPRGVLRTAADAPRLMTHAIDLPDGPHSLEIRTVDARPVRAFGIRMERDAPGVTLSALGLTGARARFLDKTDDAHWAEALRAARPDLVVLSFGSNEVGDGMMYPLADYEATLRAVMRQIRAALPGEAGASPPSLSRPSLMLVGPPDCATPAEGTMHTRPTVRVLGTLQRKLAAEEGWAFWDQFTAMGGAGSMWAWIKTGMGNPDMVHPTGSGGNALGTWQYKALMHAYAKYKERDAQGAAPTPAPDPRVPGAPPGGPHAAAPPAVGSPGRGDLPDAAGPATGFAGSATGR